MTQWGFPWAMARQLQASFEKFEAMHCVFAFVKDKSSNLTSRATLHSILNCHPLKLQQVYEGSCYNATNDNKIVGDLKYVNYEES
jgi:hypothetical protein